MAAGYEVTGCERQPQYLELQCEHVSLLGAKVRYTFAITDEDSFSPSQIAEIERIALSDCRAVVFIGHKSGKRQISWTEFLDNLGGAVPSWRALAPDYGQQLLITSQNELPPGKKGEAWLLFEDLVGDGLEFVFGRRVRRFGGRKRGHCVSDMVAQLPDAQLIVVDAKASAQGFDATWANLRPLSEYVKQQRLRQNGQNDVFSALVVSSNFSQEPTALAEVSRAFYADTSVALAFIRATVLADTVELLTNHLAARNAVRWRHVFSGGSVQLDQIKRELNRALDERY